jgi:hypothetical protein
MDARAGILVAGVFDGGIAFATAGVFAFVDG